MRDGIKALIVGTVVFLAAFATLVLFAYTHPTTSGSVYGRQFVQLLLRLNNKADTSGHDNNSNTKHLTNGSNNRGQASRAACLNGLWLPKTRRCQCDLGWTGPQCSTRSDAHLHSPSLSNAHNAKNQGKRWLLVVDTLSPTDVDHPNAIHYSALAAFLRHDKGRTLDVLVTKPPANLAHFQRTVVPFFDKGHGIRVHTLDAAQASSGAAIRMATADVVSRSYRLFKFLLDNHQSQNTHQYDRILVSNGEGVAYYALTAHASGEACLPPIVLLQDCLPRYLAQQQLRNETEIAGDVDLLRIDFMQQRSFDLAPQVIFASKPLHDAILSEANPYAWSQLPSVSSKTLHILPLLPLPVHSSVPSSLPMSNSMSSSSSISSSSSKSVASPSLWERSDEMIATRQTLVREFVYVGPLGTNGGLPVFLSAVDILLSRDAKSHRKLLKNTPLKLTFFGQNDVVYAPSSIPNASPKQSTNRDDDDEGVERVSGEQFIEHKTYPWVGRVKWAIGSGGDRSLKRLLAYVGERGKGRVLVVSAALEGPSLVLHQALRAGVPVLAANTRSASELVHLQDRRDVLFPPNDAQALSRRLGDLWLHGAVIGRPSQTLTALQSLWMSALLEMDQSSSVVDCPAKSYDLLKVINPSPSHGQNHQGGPLISVVLVHRNRPKWLQQAIRSLEMQTLPKELFEVILVDDGSTDPEALRLLERLAFAWWHERGWKVLRDLNKFLGAARNTGARHAAGKYLLFMDDDDVAKPGQLETMLRVAEVSGADVVTTGHDTFAGANLPTSKSSLGRYVPLGPALNLGIWENCFGDSNFLVHRQFFLDLKGFTEEFGVGMEDYEFLAKVVARDNRLVSVVEPQHWYRQHHKSMSAGMDLRAGRMRFLRAYWEQQHSLPRLTMANLLLAQWRFFDRDGPRPLFAESFSCGCNLTSCSIPSTSSSSSSLSTSSTTGSSASSSATSSSGSATRAITTFTSFTFLNSTSSSETSSESSTSSTTTTSTSSLTLTSLWTTACPCRVLKKNRTTQKTTTTKTTKPTCYTTLTVTPTMTRTGRGCTVLETIGIDRCEGPQCLDLKELSRILDGVPETLTTTWYVDQPQVRAPLAVYAGFAPRNGREIRVRFDAPVSNAAAMKDGKSVPCSDLLLYPLSSQHSSKHPDVGQNMLLSIYGQNVALLGKKCRATFVNAVELRLWLDPMDGYSLKAARPQQLLVFRPNALGSVGSLNKAYVSGAIELSVPDGDDHSDSVADNYHDSDDNGRGISSSLLEKSSGLRVIVHAPSMVSDEDDDVTFDLSASKGALGRPFMDASFEAAATVGELYAGQDAPLRQHLQAAALDAIKHQQLTFSLPLSLLTDFTTYAFDFSLWNVFGEVATTRHVLSKVPRMPVPLVTIVGPRDLTLPKPLILTGILSGAKDRHNSSTSNLGYDLTWFLVRSPTTMPRLQKNKRAMLVVDRLPQPGRYVFGLQVTSVPSMAFMTFTHVVDVHPAFFAVSIYGGSRLVNYRERVPLEAVCSDGTVAHFEWTCQTLDGEPCLAHRPSQSSENPLPIIELMDGKQTMFDTAVLRPGQDYELRVRAVSNDGVQVVSEPVVLSVAPDDRRRPRILLLAEEEDVSLDRNSADMSMDDGNVHLRAVVSDNERVKQELVDGAVAQHSFKWESLPYCQGRYYATLDGFWRGARAVLGDRAEHRIAIDRLSLRPGSSYCLRATAASGDTGLTSYAYRILSSSALASKSASAFTLAQAGFCRLDGNGKGTAFETKFAISCHAFPGQLWYRFVAKRRHDGYVVPWGPAQPTPRLQRILDHGHWELFVDVLRADAEHQGGLTLVTTVPVRNVSTTLVGASHLAIAERDEYLAGALRGFERTHNLDLGFQVLSIALSAPTMAYFKHGPRAPSLAQMLNLLDVLSANVVLTARDSAPLLIKALLRFLPPKLPLDLRPVVMRILLRIVEELSDNDGGDANYARVLPPETCISVLQALQPLFANARGGTSASFGMRTLFERCARSFALSPALSRSQADPSSTASASPDTLVRLAFTHFNWTSGWVTENNSSSTDENDQPGMTWCDGAIRGLTLSPGDSAELNDRSEQRRFVYYCIQADANHMQRQTRHYTVDNRVLSVGLAKGASFLPAVNLTTPFEVRLEMTPRNARWVRRGRFDAVCMFFDRGANATTSWWSEESCQTLSISATTITCRCHWWMGDYAVALKPSGAVRYSAAALRIVSYTLLGLLLVGLLMTAVFWRPAVMHRIRTWREARKLRRQEHLQRSASTVHSALPQQNSLSASTLNLPPSTLVKSHDDNRPAD